MAKTIKEKIVSAFKKEITKEVAAPVVPQVPVGFDPDMPENKQRHLR